MDKPNKFDTQRHPPQSAFSQLNPPSGKEVSPSLPEGWHTPQEDAFKGLVYLSKSVEQYYHSMVCFLGYGLLLLGLVDYISITIPPHFTDPVWEFQTIGALVEHAAIPLVGLLFVFYRHQGYIRKHERNLLGFLSWLSLLVGLLYLLMLPLGVTDTWRIYQYNNTQIAAQLSQQSQQLQQFKGKLKQAKTDEEVKQLIADIAPQGRSLQAENTQALKTK